MLRREEADSWEEPNHETLVHTHAQLTHSHYPHENVDQEHQTEVLFIRTRPQVQAHE